MAATQWSDSASYLISLLECLSTRNSKFALSISLRKKLSHTKDHLYLLEC